MRAAETRPHLPFKEFEMPIYYKIDETRQRIYSRCEGIVTYDDLRNHIEAESGLPTASFSEIFDCSDSTTNITSDEIRLLASQRKEVANRQKPAPVAVVAKNDKFFGMLRMYDILTQQIRPIRVFRNNQEAEKWLDEVTQSDD